MSRDFVEMLSALAAAGAEFLLVGAHALAAHGHPRATGDLDIWVGASPENASRILTGITGVDFAEAWPRRVKVTIEGLEIGVIGRAELLANKRAVGRPQDLADVEKLSR